MPRVARPWFRFYTETMWDRKLRSLPPDQRWVWCAILAIARESPIAGALLIGDRPAIIDDIADCAAVAIKIADKAIAAFVLAGMLTPDLDIGGFTVTAWDRRQFETDAVTDRTRKHRHRNEVGTFLRDSLERANGPGRNGIAGSPENRDREQNSSSSTGSSNAPFAVGQEQDLA